MPATAVDIAFGNSPRGLPNDQHGLHATAAQSAYRFEGLGESVALYFL
jgi:hypothetical protein